MGTWTADGDSRLSFWLRVREFAVPPSVIATATARRLVGDWAGACAAAGVDVDVSPRALARTHGRELAALVRSDLRRLAPDLLRWHWPRIAPTGLLRPGLTVTLARYGGAGRDRDGPVHLVARTPPAWADAGQRIGLALWDASRPTAGAGLHPHPRPHRRFRLDLHRHLWDALRADELRVRSGADVLSGDAAEGHRPPDTAGPGYRCAVDRWADEAAILLRAEERPDGPVEVRLGARRRLYLGPVPAGDGPAAVHVTDVPPAHGGIPLPVLPDAATWVLPDLDLVRAGLVEAGRLHPLVAAALAPDLPPVGVSAAPDPGGRPRVVECRGARHRIGLVDGVLVPLDHDPEEIRREELLAALTGTPLPCLQVIDEVHRRPEVLDDVRARLDHGDTAGALAVVEGLLGPEALLRAGALRDELAAAAARRVTHGLFRAGLAGAVPGPVHPVRRDTGRGHPRHGQGR
ncbi:hypothetical protein [Kitasatospora sp. KL5]|uniref:hypothetical protein n=1 Tax=Kitasatospora sp. KL5 TaxID=3425125 RepID=UPI003D6FF236